MEGWLLEVGIRLPYQITEPNHDANNFNMKLEDVKKDLKGTHKMHNVRLATAVENSKNAMHLHTTTRSCIKPKG